MTLSRRSVLAAGAAAAAAPVFGPAFAQTSGPVIKKPIPVSNEMLPVVGIGTAVIFDYENDPAKQAERLAVLQTLTAPDGGTLIDTAPAYGRAEDRLGELLEAGNLRSKVFLATKIPTRNADRAAQIAAMEASKRRLKTQNFELMQAWNVTDPNYDLGLLRDWKSQGVCKYTGITTSQDSAYAAIETVMRREKPDFFQVNYSLGDREAEARLLPAAMDSGCAVLTNGPFGRNSLFAKVANRPLPDFAAEIGATSWAQFFLKFLISHPAVTAVIPGTDRPQYMTDNLNAGRAPLPDAAMRQRMITYWDSLA